jgi:TonB-dependent receptor
MLRNINVRLRLLLSTFLSVLPNFVQKLNRYMKSIVALTIGLFFTGVNASAQNAVLTGKVVKIENGQEVPVELAKVLLLNADSTVFRGTSADFDGNFKIVGQPGKTLISFRQSGLKEIIMPIELKAGENEAIRVEMETPVLEFGTMQVIAFRTKTDASALNEEIKESNGMMSAQTSEQITSKGSSNTQEALTKMSGINSTNSVIYVRGMGDRYNVAYLNGLPVPSPNPELRVIPMDIFPTSIIDVLEVGKMMAPNYYGDFAGGAINIRTKKVFRTPTLNVSAGGGMNTVTTFKDFKTYNGGKKDFLGFDDGTRSLPTAVYDASLNNRNKIYTQGLYKSQEANIGTGFLNNFNTRSTIAKPATSFQIEGGNYKKFTKSGAGIGFISMVSHSTSYQSQEGTSRFINAQNQLAYNFDTKRQTFSAATTGMASIMMDMNKNQNISLNYLFINNSDDQTFESWGYHRDFGDDDTEVFSRRLTYKQNQIHNLQLVGSMSEVANKRMNVNYGTSYSLTKSVEPDRRQITAQYTDRNDTEHYRLLALDANQTHRFFSNLTESEMAGHVDADYTVFEKKNNDTVISSMKLIAGVDVKVKDRNFNFRQFNYLAKPLADSIGNNFNVNNPDAYLTDENVDNGMMRIEESANPGNGYKAYQDVFGGNIGVKYVINNRWEVLPNVRLENGFQSVENRNQTQANVIERNIIRGLDVMPSLTGKFSINENSLVRFGASRTLTRPKFFEVAPFEYLAQVAGMVQIGNPNLTNGINNNVDLRYEFYTPQSADMISIGVFGKQLITPIEQIMRPSAGGQIISFDNTDAGMVTGVEFEYAKNMSFLANKANRENTILKDFSVAGNLAYIYSQVVIKDTTGFTTNTIRPLQGASPIMANISLKYDKRIKRMKGDVELDAMKLMAAVSYTYSGKSLFAVGTQGSGDQYQFQNNMLNAVVKLDLNRAWSINLKATNIANNLFRVMQEDMVNVGDYQEVNSYRLGMNLSAGISYKVFNGRKNKELPKVE